MQLFPADTPVSLPAQRLPGRCYGFEARVDVTRHTDPERILRVEIMVSTNGSPPWEPCGIGQCTGAVNRKDRFGAPLSHWTFGNAFLIPDVDGGLQTGHKPKWINPWIRVIVTALGGDIEAEIEVDSVRGVGPPQDPVQLHHSVYLIQSVTAHDEGGSGFTTGPLATTSGTNLVSFHSYYSTFGTISDSESNSWSDAVAEADASNALYHIRVRQANNITGDAAHTFTRAYPSGGYDYSLIAEYFDGAAAPVDKAVSSNSSGVSSGTLTQAKEIIFGTAGGDAGSINYTLDENFISLLHINHGAVMGLVVGYKVVNSTASVAWNPVPSSLNPVRAIVTLKETATPAVIEQKPSGAPSYTATQAWTANTVGHWLLNEAGATSDGAEDISGNGYDLIAVKEGALDYPGLVTGPIGAGRSFNGGATDVNGLITSAVESELSMGGAMSASWVWKNNGQGNTVHDAVVFGVAATGGDNCYSMVFNEVGHQDKFSWYDAGAALGFASNKLFHPLDTDTYRMMVTRSGSGDGSTLRFWYQVLNGFSAPVLDSDVTGTADAEGTASYFTIGCSKWLDTVLAQGCLQHISEMRLWDVALSEATVEAYFADPYAEFAAVGGGEFVPIIGRGPGMALVGPGGLAG